MNPATTRLQVFTEFFDPPAPETRDLPAAPTGQSEVGGDQEIRRINDDGFWKSFPLEVKPVANGSSFQTMVVA